MVGKRGRGGGGDFSGDVNFEVMFNNDALEY